MATDGLDSEVKGEQGDDVTTNMAAMVVPSLTEIFPDACPHFLSDFVQSYMKNYSEGVRRGGNQVTREQHTATLASRLLDGGYSKTAKRRRIQKLKAEGGGVTTRNRASSEKGKHTRFSGTEGADRAGFGGSSAQKEWQACIKDTKNAMTSCLGKVGGMFSFTSAEDPSVTSQLIECKCCYDYLPFERMVQCAEGHLACRDCLRQYVSEAVYGEGRARLTCLANVDCTETFPPHQLRRALSSSTLEQLEERQKGESLSLARIENLVRCPRCDYAAILPPENKVFACENVSCLTETCRYCGVEWEEHFGRRCAEIERVSETKQRTTVEEELTKIKIRRCHLCQASFTKSSGCNKMTCRCGGKLCYVCRSPDVGYDHYCNHPREPGQRCLLCSRCSLWSNIDEDDDLAAEEVRLTGEAERAETYGGSRSIGVTFGLRGAIKRKAHA